MSNFDRIAPFYDQLAGLVFGKNMRDAQTLFLKFIPQGARVLILGGGTGWLLNELLSMNPGCNVTYIDASTKMIEMARKKTQVKNVVFIQGTEDSIPQGCFFDAVISHFYLDLFDDVDGVKVIDTIRHCSHRETLLLVCDFVRSTWWHSAMLSIMYGFFRIVSGLDAKELPDWRNLLTKGGFAEISSQSFSKGFICSAMFRVSEENKKG